LEEGYRDDRSPGGASLKKGVFGVSLGIKKGKGEGESGAIMREGGGGGEKKEGSCRSDKSTGAWGFIFKEAQSSRGLTILFS